MVQMLIVVIEDYKQSHLEYHEMFLNCKYSTFFFLSSITRHRDIKIEIVYLTLIDVYIIYEFLKKTRF